MKKIALAAVIVLVAASGAFLLLNKNTGPRDSGKIVLGVPNWPSARIKAHIFKEIIEHDLGLSVELQNGTNAVIFEAMDKSAMHLHPEVWSPNQDNLISKYVRQKGTVRAAKGQTPADQYMCVTKDTAKRTGLVELAQLTDPAMAKKFDSDGDGKGEIWIGAAGWASTVVEKIRAKSYGYDATMELKVMEESLALAEVDAAENKGQNKVFFCYTPHHMFVLHKLVPLKEPPHDPAKWRVIQPTDDPAWLEKSTAAVAWKSAALIVHYAASLEQTHPMVAKLFSRALFSREATESLGHQLIVQKIPPEQLARQWVKDNRALVNSWLL